jgi:hypothetical protein
MLAERRLEVDEAEVRGKDPIRWAIARCVVVRCSLFVSVIEG